VTAGPPYTASVHIRAQPEQVFEYFTEPEAILRWMGDYAALDPVPGGQFILDVNGVPVRGRYLAVDLPRRQPGRPTHHRQQQPRARLTPQPP
jgi:uncharacterized protein YndB with AHSA1/START domain